MLKSDEILIGHIFDAARRAVAKVAKKTRDEFYADDTLHLAVTHLIQILGEASTKISKEFQDLHADLPWREMIGMRHKIVHDYFEVNLRVVWDVATEDLPELIKQLEAIVPND